MLAVGVRLHDAVLSPRLAGGVIGIVVVKFDVEIDFVILGPEAREQSSLAESDRGGRSISCS